VLDDLKKLGVRIALDDFGTGYSSLSYLQQFPIDVIKMDQTFIAGLRNDTTSRLIIRAVVGLAHALRMEVVAEGVESAEQYNAVQTLDCDSYQGFHFARPASAEHLESMLATST
jgi:EAL domain-containing protein (putative c-di-GMP-specific phosphodiesterase class I)